MNYRVNTVKISRLHNILFILIIFAFLLSLTKKKIPNKPESPQMRREIQCMHFLLTHITRSGIAFDKNLKAI